MISRKYNSQFSVLAISIIFILRHEVNSYDEAENIVNKQITNDLKFPSKAVDNTKYYWPNGDIPYKLDGSVENLAAVIQKAIQHWTDHVCLNFHEEKGEIDKPFVIFQKKIGCNSVVGRQWWNRNETGQIVSIGQDCDSTGTIAHEIGHAIGFYHEHSRPDRDEYVKILTENIQENHLRSFSKRSLLDTERYDIPYDVGSLMHYGPKMFSKNDGNTIVSLDPMKHFSLGQRNGLSFYDKKLANLMYNCSEKCNTVSRCLNDGYMDKNCACQCPPEFNGSLCENKLPKINSPCGGIIDKPTNILSPNYPNKYPRRLQCVWWIQAPKETVIKATFNDFETINRLKNKCMMDEFEVRFKDIFNGERYCGSELKGHLLSSSSNNMVFLFSTGKLLTKKGFNITIEFINENNIMSSD